MSESRNWRLRAASEISSEAALENTHSDLISSLHKETGLSPITLLVCVQRGLTTPELIQNYLSPRFDGLTHPMRLKDMDLAVSRLSELRKSGGKVRVFGDYDVDGTTGAALLSWILREFGFSFDATQPDRFKDGYGLNVQAVEDAVKDGIQVLLTVDCGISSFDAANRAKELGLDLIVVDHHQIDPVRGIPVGTAIVNPQRADCESGLKQLCGCGLAFYLAIALRSHGRENGWFVGQAEPNLKQHLDLVVMATAADMVPLTGDNHILVRYGLDVLKNSTKPGVKALLEAAGLAFKDISPSHLGFVLGPRINASGRMHSASLALELLTTTDFPRATELALELEKLNRDRAEIQNEIWDEIRVRVEKGISEGKYRHGIAVADPGWHEGVVGIVASRVTETFKKPAAVVALREDFGKGSVRSYGGKDVLAGLRACSEHLLGFGGHKYAAGLSVGLDHFEAFAEAFDRAFEAMPEGKDATALWIEGECSIGDLDIKTLQELEKLGPFGPGNPEPVFIVKAAVQNHRVLKERHLKLSLSQSKTLGMHSRPRIMDAIWFNAAERAEVLAGASSREEREWAGVPELNRFRGQTTPSFRIRDWRKIEENSEVKG
jgi:single-stranded-DNA-specific exonuclease